MDKGGAGMRLCELENKEVINACDCKKLGYVVDLIIDECKRMHRGPGHS